MPSLSPNKTESNAIGLLPRFVAWGILQAVASGAYADVALDRALEKTPLKIIDRGFVMELAYGAIRRRKLLDAWIDQLGKVNAKK